MNKQTAKGTCDSRTVAYMLKHTGELIPVDTIRRAHVYGASSDAVGAEVLEENTYAATFLCKYDKSEVAVKTVQVFLARVLYNAAVYMPATKADFYDAINNAAVNWSMVEYEKGSVNPYELWQELNIDTDERLTEFYMRTLNYTGDKAKAQLNQNFTRVRYGVKSDDLYNSSPNSKDIVFRISAAGFVWQDIIYCAVIRLTKILDIQTVSVVSDYESTGLAEPYTTNSGAPIWFMPLNAFLLDMTEKEKA